MSAIAPSIRGARAGRSWRIAALVPTALAVLFVAGYWPLHVAQKRLVAEASAVQAALPRVKVAVAAAVDSGRSLSLPGTLVASKQALVFARATGYVRLWRVDIGDRVHAGDVLAELDTPEIDQQLDQARATLQQKGAAMEQAIAGRDFAKLTAERQDTLFAQSLVAKQDDDQANAQLKVSEANVNAAKADVGAAQSSVRELGQMVSFGHVVAPFDGRITQRNIDVGSLVAAGGASGASTTQPLFRIEATDPIRVFVQVPQAFALSVKDGATVSVTVRQLAGRVFHGQVTRTAGSLDPASRTLNVEIDVPNPAGELLGGMFADVSIAVAVARRIVRVPSSAVITDAHGVHVATVDGAGQVHLVAVVPGLDNGSEIDLVDGLVGGDQVIVNPAGDVTDGAHVEAVRGAP